MTTRDTALDSDGLARLEGRLQSLVKQPWSMAHVSYGGEVRVGFGALVRGRRGYTNGEWRLGTRASPWSLEREGKQVASGRDDEQTWAASLEVVKGHVVTGVNVSVPEVAA